MDFSKFQGWNWIDLENRYTRLIPPHVDIIEGKTILDLASHDGRWSYVALQHGAKSVIGIESRQHLVDQAKELVPNASFICADVNTYELPIVDTVFLFGFLYHALQPVNLLDRISRCCRHILIDTNINPATTPTLHLKIEDTDAVQNASTERIVAYPTKRAIELMCKAFGLIIKHYGTYKNGKRAIIKCEVIRP